MKPQPGVYNIPEMESPPSRGVWIETERLEQQQQMLARRPPRGGCGLKYGGLTQYQHDVGRPPRGGCGLKYLLV